MLDRGGGGAVAGRMGACGFGGTIHRAFSYDEGETWTTPEPTTLKSPESCCFLTRIEATDDLVVVWNHSTYDSTHVQFGIRRPADFRPPYNVL